MSEEKKYYTPKLAEFHEGFEYEAYIPDKEIWSKEVFYPNDSHLSLVKFVDLQDDNTLRRIRVKYLDREDIDSLLFVEMTAEEKQYFGVVGNCFLKKIWLVGNGKYTALIVRLTPRITGDGNTVEVFIKKEGALRGYGSALGVFIGRPKNKSEFKRLIVQLVNVKL